MIKVIVPAVWSPDRQTSYKVDEAGSLLDVVRRFTSENPVFERRLFDPDGAPLSYVNICIDDEIVDRQERETTDVPAGSTITIISPMAGG
jgi:sulfur-carrier protein